MPPSGMAEFIMKISADGERIPRGTQEIARNLTTQRR